MGQGAFLYNNLAMAATITSGSTLLGDGPLTNLQDAQPRHRARFSGTSCAFVIDLGSIQTLDRFALISTNLTSAATRRLRVSTTSSTFAANITLDTTSGAANTDTKWNGNVHHPRIASISGRYVGWDLADASLSSIDVGIPVVGLMSVPTINYSYQHQRGRLDLGRREINELTGTHFAKTGAKPRTAIVTFASLYDSEVEGFVEEMDRVAGVSTDVLFDPDVSLTAAQLAQRSIYGSWKEVGAVLATQAYLDLNARSFRHTERL